MYLLYMNYTNTCISEYDPLIVMDEFFRFVLDNIEYLNTANVQVVAELIDERERFLLPAGFATQLVPRLVPPHSEGPPAPMPWEWCEQNPFRE